MRVARAAEVVPLEPRRARELWTDVRRWPMFVEGFSRAMEVSPEWPEKGATLVWESTGSGRGRVTERVAEAGPETFATELDEDSLRGLQALTFAADEHGTRVEVRLEYELARRGPLTAMADLLFVRRALRDSLRRTLRRFAMEAEEEAGLR